MSGLVFDLFLVLAALYFFRYRLEKETSLLDALVRPMYLALALALLSYAMTHLWGFIATHVDLPAYRHHTSTTRGRFDADGLMHFCLFWIHTAGRMIAQEPLYIGGPVWMGVCACMVLLYLSFRACRCVLSLTYAATGYALRLYTAWWKRLRTISRRTTQRGGREHIRPAAAE